MPKTEQTQLSSDIQLIFDWNGSTQTESEENATLESEKSDFWHLCHPKKLGEKNGGFSCLEITFSSLWWQRQKKAAHLIFTHFGPLVTWFPMLSIKEILEVLTVVGEIEEEVELECLWIQGNEHSVLTE